MEDLQHECRFQSSETYGEVKFFTFCFYLSTFIKLDINTLLPIRDSSCNPEPILKRLYKTSSIRAYHLFTQISIHNALSLEITSN